MRHQLAVYSPIALPDLLGGALDRVLRRAELPRRVEEELRRLYDVERVTLTASGTQALQLALAPSAGRLVALPAFSCYDVASAAIGAGVRVALYDLDPDTLAPDLDSLERVLRAGAEAVVAGPLYGVPLPWDGIERLVSSHGARLIEDAAQGHGASWHGRPLGSLGAESVLSFGRGKGWTGGGGGALLHREGPGGAPGREPASGEARLAAATLAQWLLGRPAVYGIPMSIPSLGLGETLYHEPTPPRAPSAAALALLERTRERSAREAQARRANAESLLQGLRDIHSARTIRAPADSVPGYLRLPVRLPAGLASFSDPDRARRLGVATSYPTTLATLPPLVPLLTGPENRFPGATSLVDTLVTLPTHSRVTVRDRHEILSVLAAGEHPLQIAATNPLVTGRDS